MNHRSCSKSRGRILAVCVCVLVCVLGGRHELYMSYAPASVTHMLHTVISAASSLRDEACKARARRGLYAAAQHDAAVCTLLE